MANVVSLNHSLPLPQLPIAMQDETPFAQGTKLPHVNYNDANYEQVG